MRLWSIDGTLLNTLAEHTGDSLWRAPFDSDGKTLAFSPDGTLLASGSYDGIVRLWSTDGTPRLTELREDHTLAGHTSSIDTIAFSPDGKILASASIDGTVRLWGVPP